MTMLEEDRAALDGDDGTRDNPADLIAQETAADAIDSGALEPTEGESHACPRCYWSHGWFMRCSRCRQERLEIGALTSRAVADIEADALDAAEPPAPRQPDLSADGMEAKCECGRLVAERGGLCGRCRSAR